jgi:hypothetical protein
MRAQLPLPYSRGSAFSSNVAPRSAMKNSSELLGRQLHPAARFQILPPFPREDFRGSDAANFSFVVAPYGAYDELSRLPGSAVQHVNLPKACDGTAVADSVRLYGFALAIIEGTAQLVTRLTAQSITGAPKIRRARLIGNIAQHSDNLAFLDFPEGLSAELEIVALLIDGKAAVAVNQNAVLNATHEVIQRNVLARRFQRNVGHTRERNVTPALCVEATVRSITSDERRRITRGLPIDKHAILHQVPALCRCAFVVVANGCESGGLDLFLAGASLNLLFGEDQRIVVTISHGLRKCQGA